MNIFIIVVSPLAFYGVWSAENVDFLRYVAMSGIASVVLHSLADLVSE